MDSGSTSTAPPQSNVLFEPTFYEQPDMVVDEQPIVDDESVSTYNAGTVNSNYTSEIDPKLLSA